MDKILTKRNTIIFLAVLTAWRIFLNATLELHPDEAYYWMWSRHLELSYFDHPPMIAYFIRLTTLLSSSELWVRFSGVLVSVAMSVLIWILSKKLFAEEKIAAASVWLLNAYPLMMSGTVILTPDVPAFFFWSLGIFFAWKVFETKEIYYWYLLGLVFGLALVSKYTSILLAPCLLAYMLFTDEKRWLKTIHPYLSLLISLIAFLPVVIWNWRHSWISFSFQAGHGLRGFDYLDGVVRYIGGQLLVLSPFAWLFGIAAAVIFMFSKDKAKFFLGITSAPIILFFALTSLKQSAGPNWPVLAYFTFTVAFCRYFLDGVKWKKYAWILSFAFSLFLSILATAHARFAVIPLSRISSSWAETDATSWFYGWKDLAKELEKYNEASFILTPSHTLAASLDYYLKERIPVHADPNIGRFSQYNLWKLPVKPGSMGIYVSLEGEALGAYERYFEGPVKTDYVTTYRNKMPIRKFRIIYGKSKSAAIF